MHHRGVVVDDPRNAGPLAFFAPKEETRETLRHRLTVVMRGKSPTDVEAAVNRVLYKIARGPIPSGSAGQPIARRGSGLIGSKTVERRRKKGRRQPGRGRGCRPHLPGRYARLRGLRSMPESTSISLRRVAQL